jgi:glutamate synthase domain-containing protein 2
MRRIFIVIVFILLLAEALIAWKNPGLLWTLILVVPVVVIGVFDLTQKRHSILRNFPLIGHVRYFSELIAPELRQYFVESDTDGRPFSRLQRAYVYKRAKLELETHPFGTEKNVYQPGYYWMAHSMYPLDIPEKTPKIKIGTEQCTQPYEASIFNVSAMSFGSLGKNAVASLNRGAKLGGFYQNTGEGGVSDYHLKYGGDLVFQIGTAYFGCRDKDGKFSEKYFTDLAQLPSVKMIEIKLSQGAKPGLGGVLPAAKNTDEIAKIRRLEPHKMVHSPPSHQAFSDAPGLLKFIARLRELSGGKPVGFKVCIGSRKEFADICEAMISTGMRPDFITVDGGEGGTGAAPIEFSDNVGMPLDEGLVFVCDTLRGYDLKKHITVIASGKVITGFDIVKNLAIGADLCNSARGMMFALGCIQALKCDTNNCPTGVATHKAHLQAGLDETDKSVRVANYHKETVKSAQSILAAAGLKDFPELNRSFIYKRVDQTTTRTLEEIWPTQKEGELLKKGAKTSGEPGRPASPGTTANQNTKTQNIPGDYPSHTNDNRKNS